LQKSKLNEIKKLIVKRAAHYPLQYLLGETEFYGYKFQVDENVFIPRPETEILIDAVIKYIDESEKDNLQILELGTGTGIIPIALSRHFQDKEKNLQFLATDISETSLTNAEKNCKLHNINSIKFLKSDFFESISGKFDYIISNPPYISPEEMDKLQNEIKDHEPKAALDGGKDGIQIYKKILENAAKYLLENGMIFFEISANQKDEVVKIAESYNFKIIEAKQDYNQFDRVLVLKINK